MHKIVVTSTGLGAEERERIESAALRLGFEFVGNLDRQVTHLVASSVRTDKYRVAVAERLPVVRMAWIDDSYDTFRLKPERPYLLPPLHNLTIAVSGLSIQQEERVRLEELVTAQGGTMQRELSQGCTHLVVDAPRGQKFEACCTEHALQHILVVSLGWLAACVREGVYVDERPFLMPKRFEPFLAACVIHVWPSSCSEPLLAELKATALAGGATRLERVSPAVRPATDPQHPRRPATHPRQPVRPTGDSPFASPPPAPPPRAHMHLAHSPPPCPTRPTCPTPARPPPSPPAPASPPPP